MPSGTSKSRHARAGWRGLALAASLLFATRPAGAETFGLEALERHAVLHRSSVDAARARVSVARARETVARAPRLPTVTASLNAETSPGARLIRVEDVHGSEYLVTGSRALGDPGVLNPDFRQGALLSIEGRLLDFGRTSSSVRAAEAETGAATAGVRVEQRAVVLEVRAAYVDWLWRFEARTILARAAADSRALLDAASARVEEGSERSATVVAARLDEARARLELERAEAELERARLGLELAAAVTLPAGAKPDEKLLDLATPPGPADAPEALALARRREAAQAAAAGSRAASYPIVTALAEAGLRGQGATLFPLYRVGVAVVIPIFDGGASSSAARVAVAQAGELLAEATEARARARSSERQARATAERARRQLDIAKEIVAAADAVVGRAEEERTLGESGRESLVQARLARARADLDVLAIRVERVRALLSIAPTKR